MTTFLDLPGVRIQEVMLGSPPIIGVSTSTAAFVGDAPPNTAATVPAGFSTAAGDGKPSFQYPGVARLVTSADQFTHDYIGDPDLTTSPATLYAKRSNDLTRAVYGFFTNGGTACYVFNTSTTAAPKLANALQALEVFSDISIVAAPGQNGTDDYTALKDHVEKMQDRFAILEPLALNTSPGSLVKPHNSQYTAIYYPRVQVGKKLDSDPDTEYASPSGHIAGAYARVDTSRGVFKAPANEQLLGVLGVEQLLTDDQQNQMNKKTSQVNALRVFSGNVVVFGARTTSDNALWLYVNVRRLVIYIEQSLKVGLRWAVFEPNNLTLRKQIERSVRGFLDAVWRDGGLFGANSDEAYYVRFPPSFNTADDQAQGRLTVEIGLRVTYPAEFIIIRIGLLLQAANATT